MTATDPRPRLAAALAARLAPAAEALAAAYAEDANPELPPPAESGYDGSEDETHHCGEVYAGSQETPGFEVWLEDLERRFGPVPLDGSRDGSLPECNVSGRKFVGDLMTPEFRAWRERQRRRTEEALACCLDRSGEDPGGGGEEGAAAGLHDISAGDHDKT